MIIAAFYREAIRMGNLAYPDPARMFTFPRFDTLGGQPEPPRRRLRALRVRLRIRSASLLARVSAPWRSRFARARSWIEVLAKRAGIDIYDTIQVAFVNMNHGPLDPILKTWISRGAPMLPGHMVTRVSCC